MSSNPRRGLVFVYGIVYLALTSSVAYWINQHHVRQSSSTVDALREMGVQIHLKPNGKVLYVDLFAYREVDKAIPLVGEFSELEMLTLSGTSVTDEQLQVIAKLPELRHLALNDTGVSGKGLKCVENHRKLEVINLDDCPQFTDEGLAFLANHTSLERIHLNHTNVTNAGIKHLHGLLNLKHLLVYDTGVDQAGVDLLKKSVPNVNVIISE